MDPEGMDLKQRHYFSKAKFMNDYSDIFTHEEIAAKPRHIFGFFNKDAHKKNKKKYNLDSWR